jgi:phospholipid/cholesterol/gamma-HCH transport system substrate-binding protein
MNKNIIETITGGVVIMIAIWFMYLFVTKTSSQDNNDGNYEISASFENSGGVENGTAIMIAGIKVGVITKKILDQNNYMAELKMAINNNINIPDDSSASITSSGLLGEKYVDISPGGNNEMLKKDGVIKHTQSSVNLETLIGKMMFSTKEAK